MKQMTDKNVLFIGPEFYDYHIEIIRALQKLGASVDFYSERPMTFGYSVLKNLNSNLLTAYVSRHFNKILNHTKGVKYDYIFVIRGHLMPVEVIQTLKERNPNAVTILYQWDALINNDYTKIIDEFDHAYSFDRGDCRSIDKLCYQPLFYTKKYYEYSASVEANDLKIDILFVGYLHGDRYDVVRKVSAFCDLNRLNFYAHLYLPVTSYLKSIIQGSKYDNRLVKFAPLTSAGAAELMRRSRHVLDIENPNQNGLTIRTFEALAAGKKIITTNTSIRHEGFYDPRNIYILDRDTCYIDPEFVRSSAINILDVGSYSLDSWIRNVFRLLQDKTVS